MERSADVKPAVLNRLGLIVMLTLAGLQGCATRMEMGAPPRVERLGQLHPRVSTQNDVLLLLGEPRGYGEARLDQSFPRQRVWLYEYIVSEGGKIETAMLLVFFVNEKFDGYMWFADAIHAKPRPEGGQR